jgi:hypothetical protein
LRKGARQAEQTAEQGCGRERSNHATDRNGDRDRADRRHAGQRESKADERDADSKHALRDDLHTGFEAGAHTEGVAPGNTEQNRKHDRADRHAGPLTELGDGDGAEFCGRRQCDRQSDPRNGRAAPRCRSREARDIKPASADRGAAADRSLTHGRDGRLWLSLPGDHALVQIGDAVAAGTLEEEGQQTVHQTGQATEHHAQAEGARREQVLEVSLANRLGVFSEEAVRIHAVKSSPVGPQQDC